MESHSRTASFWRLATIAVVSLSLTSALNAADGKSAVTRSQESNRVDPNSVPEGSPAQLLVYINKLQAEREAPAQTVQMAVLSASEKVLVGARDEMTLVHGVRAKAWALRKLAAAGDSVARTRLLKLAAELRKDSRRGLAAEGSLIYFGLRADNVANLSAEELQKLVQDLDDFLAPLKVDRAHMNVAIAVCQGIEKRDPDAAAQAYDALGAHFVAHQDRVVALEGDRMAGAAGRLRLIGKTVEVSGDAISGAPLDWSHYKGKVVLVDFWATWCGPCNAELPALKALYARDRARGFEIIAVPLDEDVAKVKQFLAQQEVPWTNLMSADPASRGWNDPRAIQFGVSAVPTTLLIDRQGRVAALNVHGDELDQKVQQLLAEPLAAAK